MFLAPGSFVVHNYFMETTTVTWSVYETEDGPGYHWAVFVNGKKVECGLEETRNQATRNAREVAEDLRVMSAETAL